MFLSLSLSLPFFLALSFSTRLVLRNLALVTSIPRPGKRSQTTTSLQHRVTTTARAISSRSPSIHRLSPHRASKSPASASLRFAGRGQVKNKKERNRGYRRDIPPVLTIFVLRDIDRPHRWNARVEMNPRFLASLADHAQRRPLSTFQTNVSLTRFRLVRRLE